MNNFEDTFYLLVAGSRNYNDYQEMCSVLDLVLKNQKLKHKIVIVSGGAKGTDSLAERYADERGYKKHIITADWNKYGKSAGFIRNNEMHLYIATPVDKKRGCICFWSLKEQSRGTKQNFKLARTYNTPLRVYDYA